MSKRRTIAELVEEAPDPSNEAAFVEWSRQFTDETRVEERVKAEDAARSLLRNSAGHMSSEDVRALGALFNVDYHNGRHYKTRFSPAFHGASIDRLNKNLDAFNSFVGRIWNAATDEEALEAVHQVLIDKNALPGAGRSLPTMLMYLRNPEKYAVWMNYTHRGLQALTGFRADRGDGKTAFLSFSEKVQALRDKYGIPSQEVDVILSWAGRVSEKTHGAASRISIPSEDIDWFKRVIASDEYARTERDYKFATHRVISRLFSQEMLRSEQFGPLLTATTQTNYPDLGQLGFNEQQAEEIRSRIRSSGFNGLRQTLLNLSGGQFGFAQWVWMPQAIEYGLQEDLVAAFDDLLHGPKDLAERIDSFRENLVEIQTALRDRGGFLANWTVMKISLSFIASLLGAYDPSRYTFYAATKLQKALEDFGAPWPKGTNGERYTEVCLLVTEVSDALRRAGVPISDLIDAQSFMYMRADRTQTRATEADENKPLDPAVLGSELATRINWDEARATSLIELTLRSKQLLFYGPPGTGKTYVAKELASLIAGEGEGRVELVQFHPSYSYEDFVEGIRPRLAEDDQRLTYEMRKGVLRRIIDRAAGFPDERFFLVIDEINRANLPRVFGELLYGLEYRGRENPVVLPYSDTELFVPANLWFIGTMNTADRSIALVDVALRRRFRHLHFPPDPDALVSWLSENSSEDVAQDAANRLNALNAELSQLLGDDRLIGHSFLMRFDLQDVGYETIWEEDLAPVLQEHLFNRIGEIAGLRNAFLISP